MEPVTTVVEEAICQKIVGVNREIIIIIEAVGITTIATKIIIIILSTIIITIITITTITEIIIIITLSETIITIIIITTTTTITTTLLEIIHLK